MSRFLVIEGLDGAGKSTQIELLKKFCRKEKLKYKFIHFPRYYCPIYGEMIARFLRGEFGKADEVDPYLVSLLYAGDRNDAKMIIKKWLKQNYLLIADRYFYSNVAFQSAKMKNSQEKDKVSQWLMKLEYKYNKIPRPNLSIFLHLPFSFIFKQLKSNRSGGDRHYLKGFEDIHESNIRLQQNVEKEYLKLTKVYSDFQLIKCFSTSEKVLSPEEIHQKIISLLREKKII